jgi:acetyl-CoA carboxylase biotin carboxylase subunit
VAKLITSGESREEAIAYMKRALDEFWVAPLKTTVPFLKEIISDTRFSKGNYFTNFVEEFLEKEER